MVPLLAITFDTSLLHVRIQVLAVSLARLSLSALRAGQSSFNFFSIRFEESSPLFTFLVNIATEV